MGAYLRTKTLMLAMLQQEWLPSTCVPTKEALSSSLANAGVGRIAFLRHGATSKQPTDGGVDFDRQLTNIGREQAQEAGSVFGPQFHPFFPTILVSPAPRTIETAKLFLNAANQSEVQLQSDSILYDGTMQPSGCLLFRKIGYSGLQDYLNCENDADQNVARIVLGSYAHNVINIIMNVLQQSEKTSTATGTSKETTLWMIGHAIYLPAVALGIATILECADKNLLLTTNTVEAEGYVIDNIHNSSVQLLQRPQGSLLQN